MYCNNTVRLLMQFHITGRCNLRCKHCYRTEGDVEPLPTADVKQVIDQYTALLKRYNEAHGIRKRGHINITGGEPFFREDIEEIIDYLGARKELFSFGVLTNGSLLDDGHIEALLRNDVAFVQLSIDGNRETHDALRAPGDYDRTFRKAQELEKRGVRTYVSFTANRMNYRHLPLVARECRKRGVTKLWTDRLVPIGNGGEIAALAITCHELPDYLRALRRAQGSFLTRLLFPKTAVTANRALQFQGAKGDFYTCSAGRSLITVDEFGQVMPCRRMPIICGNVQESTLEEIYYGSETLQALRKNDLPRGCSGCRYSYYCRGGARCQSYALTGSFLRPDPACPLAAAIRK